MRYVRVHVHFTADAVYTEVRKHRASLRRRKVLERRDEIAEPHSVADRSDAGIATPPRDVDDVPCLWLHLSDQNVAEVSS